MYSQYNEPLKNNHDSQSAVLAAQYSANKIFLNNSGVSLSQCILCIFLEESITNALTVRVASNLQFQSIHDYATSGSLMTLISSGKANNN